MDKELKVGDLVFTGDAVDYPEGLFAMVTSLDKEGEGEEARYDVDVMFDNTEENWGMSDLVWDEDLGAWTFFWA